MSRTAAPNAYSIGVIGAGRLGSSLALALTHAGYPVTAVASRQKSAATALAARLPGAQVHDARALVKRSELVFLTVPDDALSALADTLPWRKGQAVVHCSGALGLAALDAAAAVGAQRGCLHPLQTFPKRFAEPKRFAGIVCGVEGDGALAKRLTRYCRELGAGSVSLARVDRARYHAAAVFASNYVVALHAAATEAWTLAGLPRTQARTALGPLTAAAAEQVRQLPLHAALTGPLARGDAATIARHLRALADVPELATLYRDLAKQLLALPLTLSTSRRKQLLALLQGR